VFKKAHYSDKQEKTLSLQYSKTNKKSLTNVLKSISDEKSLSIFQAIADVNSNNVEIGLKKLDLSRKQYYSRISTMRETGLIKRQSGRYYLTPFGKVVYCCTMITKNALDNYYELKAVEITEDSGFSNEELSKLVNVLIHNKEVKEFLTKKCNPRYT
jgi:predicted metal-binding transcription factor (methanogenesis marker protein 9)